MHCRRASEAVGLLDSDGDGQYDDGLDAPSAYDIPISEIKTGIGADAPVIKQRRYQTIASIVNTMAGTTMVALPFGFAESGLGAGLVLMLILGVISCYTCLIIVDAGEGSVEFSDCVRRYLGVKVQIVAWAMSVAIIIGAVIVYHILMAETLYDCVLAIARVSTGESSFPQWRREYAALVPWFLFPISNWRDMSLLVKLNSGGALFLWYTIIFVLYHGFHALTGSDINIVNSLPAGAPDFGPDGKLNYVLGGKLGFGLLGAMLALSFFAHNVVQPIVKNADPKTKRADIAIG
jgi:amino acid permease